jgi:hypothetical protein
MTKTVKKESTTEKTRKTAPRKKVASARVSQMTASHEEIAHLAHRFWSERGQQHGSHEQDWFRAEQELFGKVS